jgi:hypothetical protein
MNVNVIAKVSQNDESQFQMESPANGCSLFIPLPRITKVKFLQSVPSLGQ